MSLSCEMALQAKANSSASLDFLAQVKLICWVPLKAAKSPKTNMAKRWKITIFNRRNIFIHGGFSTFMFSLRVDSLDAKSKWHNKPPLQNVQPQLPFCPENMMPTLHLHPSAMFRNKKHGKTTSPISGYLSMTCQTHPPLDDWASNVPYVNLGSPRFNPKTTVNHWRVRSSVPPRGGMFHKVKQERLVILLTLHTPGSPFLPFFIGWFPNHSYFL